MKMGFSRYKLETAEELVDAFDLTNIDLRTIGKVGTTRVSVRQNGEFRLEASQFTMIAGKAGKSRDIAERIASGEQFSYDMYPRKKNERYSDNTSIQPRSFVTIDFGMIKVPVGKVVTLAIDPYLMEFGLPALNVTTLYGGTCSRVIMGFYCRKRMMGATSDSPVLGLVGRVHEIKELCLC